jgi:hypothetical protein
MLGMFCSRFALAAFRYAPLWVSAKHAELVKLTTNFLYCVFGVNTVTHTLRYCVYVILRILCNDIFWRLFIVLESLCKCSMTMIVYSCRGCALLYMQAVRNHYITSLWWKSLLSIILKHYLILILSPPFCIIQLSQAASFQNGWLNQLYKTSQ